MFDNKISRFLLCKKLPIFKTCCRISYEMFDILQEISKVILLLCHESSKRRVANFTKSNRLNLFSRIRETVKEGLEHLFSTTRSSHFFNKADSEQCLFNNHFYDVLQDYSPSSFGQETARDISVFESSCRCHLSTTYGGGFTLSLLIAESQAGKMRIPIFMVFGLSRSGIEPRSSVSAADVLLTRLRRSAQCLIFDCFSLPYGKSNAAFKKY